MPRKKYTEGQIALVVKELENGAKVEELCRKLGCLRQRSTTDARGTPG